MDLFSKDWYRLVSNDTGNHIHDFSGVSFLRTVVRRQSEADCHVTWKCVSFSYSTVHCPVDSKLAYIPRPVRGFFLSLRPCGGLIRHASHQPEWQPDRRWYEIQWHRNEEPLMFSGRYENTAQDSPFLGHYMQ